MANNQAESDPEKSEPKNQEKQTHPQEQETRLFQKAKPVQSNLTDKENGNFQKVSFLIYLSAAFIIFILLIWNFIMPVFMAAILSGITYPIYTSILKYTGKNKAIASLLSILVLTLLILVPLGAVGFLAYSEIVDIVRGFHIREFVNKWSGALEYLREKLPFLSDQLNTEEIIRRVSAQVQRVGTVFVKGSAAVSMTIAGFFIDLGLMLLTMFYFYIDGPWILRKLIRLSPLRDDYEENLITRFLLVSKGTLKGTLLIGLIQGAMCSILFFSVGVPSTIFLGVLVFFATFIPVGGSALIWFPVAVTLLIGGHWIKAIIVLGVGGMLVGSVDNVLRPVLVGKDIKMHDLMVLFSTLGGIAMFGLVGVVVGPIIASFFLSILSIFEDIFSRELKATHVPETAEEV